MQYCANYILLSLSQTNNEKINVILIIHFTYVNINDIYFLAGGKIKQLDALWKESYPDGIRINMLEYPGLKKKSNNLIIYQQIKLTVRLMLEMYQSMSDKNFTKREKR